MRSSDIVQQLARVLPTIADDFTTQCSITSIESNLGVATATCAENHNLTPNSVINITGAMTPIEVKSVVINGAVSTVTTEVDHDVTEGNIENALFDNGEFKLLRAPNRRTIVVEGDPTGATLLLNGSNVYQSYNGLYQVSSTPSANTFTYLTAETDLLPAMGDNIQARTNPRISSAVDFESLHRAYTKQEMGDAWIFVVMGDAIADKSRAEIENIQASQFYNQRLIQTVSLYVFMPASAQIAGRSSRDRCEELLNPICRSLVQFQPPSLLHGGSNPLMIVSHGMQAYNGAIYVHEYVFQSTLQMGESDALNVQDDVAFRDIEIDMNIESFNTNVDLDDDPL